MKLLESRFIVPVPKIHLILMWIRILVTHWEKMDPDPNPNPGHFLKIYWIFFNKPAFIFFSLLYAKTWWTIQKSEKCYNFFFNSSDLGLESKKVFFCSFWLISCPLNPDPWIRMILRIRIQEAKILQIQRIRILSTA